MPKNLQRASSIRWALLVSAISLTVVGGALGWIEVVNDASPAPRSFVLGIAMVGWVAFVALSCALLVVKKITKRIDRATNQIIDALMVAKLVEENGNVRWINDRR